MLGTACKGYCITGILKRQIDLGYLGRRDTLGRIDEEIHRITPGYDITKRIKPISLLLLIKVEAVSLG